MQVGHLLGEHLVDELKVLVKLGATGVSWVLRYNFLFVRAADDAHIVCIVLSLFSTGRESRLGQFVSWISPLKVNRTRKACACRGDPLELFCTLERLLHLTRDRLSLGNLCVACRRSEWGMLVLRASYWVGIVHASKDARANACLGIRALSKPEIKM